MPTETYFAPVFSSRYGAQEADAKNPSQNLPAICAGGDTLKLDLSPLLVFGKMRMDMRAFHEIVTSDEPSLDFLAETLSLLKDYELLDLFDAQAFSDIEQLFIEEQARLAIENRSLWIEQVRSCIAHWDQLRPMYRDAYKGSLAVPRKMPFLLQGALTKLGEDLNLENAEAFRDIVFRAESKSAEENLVTDAAIRVAAEYVGSVQVWRSQIGNGPGFDWDNLDRLTRWNDSRSFDCYLSEKTLATGRLVVEQQGVRVEDLEVERVVAYLRDPALDDFRFYISHCVQSGEEITREIPKSDFNALVRANVARKKMQPLRIALSTIAPGVGEMTDLGAALVPSDMFNESNANLVDAYGDAALEAGIASSIRLKQESRAKRAKKRAQEAIVRHFVD